MKKTFHIERIGTDDYKARLVAESLPDTGNRVPALRILQSITESPLNCVTVVFEKEYVDQDYQDELAVFYSKAFKDYSHRCTRLHFFAVEIPTKSEKAITDFTAYKDHYLGFMVLRPTDLQRVGRTYLAVPIKDPNTEFITCLAPFKAHILGHEFPISAMPFVQQDTQVGACAQACLWMVARYMSRRFGYREFLPGEINQCAKSRSALGRHYPAETGLTLVQMLDALQGMFLSAISYQKPMLDDSHKHIEKAYPITADLAIHPTEHADQLDRQRTAKLADIAYRYIESGLPVIFATSNHAIVGIGHKFDPTISATVAIERIPSFYVNNDNAGPYIEMPLFGPVSNVITFDQIQLVIVVVPSEATLSGEEAERIAVNDIEQLLIAKPDDAKPETLLDILSKYRPDLAPLLVKLEYRTYLCRSVELQRDIRADVAVGNLDVAVGETLVQLDYPKYVWITEVSSATLLNQAAKLDRRCLGRVIVDSTAPARTRGVIANHFADLLILNDRQGKQDSEVTIHRNSTPFRHKFMTN
ncbi:MAG TPA: hypothetical protein VNP98_07260 [Chthoniobacterales bacterium]|nr:hypothetical protein [Chthoniobacterales bacterium]